MAATDWTMNAPSRIRRPACRDEDPELFFPVGSTGVALVQIERAKQVCRRCPIAKECLQLALRLGAEGIWGGTTEDERRKLLVVVA